MSTREHHYRFEVTRPAPSHTSTTAVQRFHAGAIGTSPANAEAAVRKAYPTWTRTVLAGVEPAGQRCGDDRCAVCYPSSRNRIVQHTVTTAYEGYTYRAICTCGWHSSPSRVSAYATEQAAGHLRQSAS